jgi:hypothetical protein
MAKCHDECAEDEMMDAWWPVAILALLAQAVIAAIAVPARPNDDDPTQAGVRVR